jgi:hypothetical protein
MSTIKRPADRKIAFYEKPNCYEAASNRVRPRDRVLTHFRRPNWMTFAESSPESGLTAAGSRPVILVTVYKSPPVYVNKQKNFSLLNYGKWTNSGVEASVSLNISANCGSRSNFKNLLLLSSFRSGFDRRE